MARRSSAALLSNVVEIDRQAKRIGRQQKRLEKELGLDPFHHTQVPRQVSIKLKNFEPMTDTQDEFWQDFNENGADAYVLYGSAGTGKSMISIYNALKLVLGVSPYKRLIIIRSAVQSREIGFLVGDEKQKMEAFETPYASLVAEMTGDKMAYQKLKDIGKIEFHSNSFLRGITFNDSIVVVDEIQNFNFGEMNTIMTRIGNTSKIIFCGDGKQDDLVHKKNDVSGFRDFLAVANTMAEFRCFRFTSDDIVRSGLCKSWIIAVEQLGLT